MAKGTVEAGAAVTNLFKLEVPGLVDTYWTRIGELSTELVLAEMADGTWQTTGRIKPGETEADQYLHHVAERVALEAYFIQCQTGAPGHKRPALLFYHGADGQPVAAVTLVGFMLKGRKTPELNVAQDGEGVVTTWMIAFDSLLYT